MTVCSPNFGGRDTLLEYGSKKELRVNKGLKKIMIDILDNENRTAEISLRFCSCCFKKFAPHPDRVLSDSARFFVPTLDALSREFFAYIEVPKKLLYAVYDREETFSMDLADVAEVLHIEIGDYPSRERKQEIEMFFDMSPTINLAQMNRLAA